MKKGYFGIGIYHIKKEVNLGTLWRHAYCFNADFVFTIGRRYQRQSSDKTDTSSHIPCYHYNTIDDLKNNLPTKCKIVGIELLPDARKLSNYVHPMSCIYLLGAEDHGLSKEALKVCHDVVYIPSSPSLNVSTTGSIVMYDRVTKGSYYR